MFPAGVAMVKASAEIADVHWTMFDAQRHHLVHRRRTGRRRAAHPARVLGTLALVAATVAVAVGAGPSAARAVANGVVLGMADTASRPSASAPPTVLWVDPVRGRDRDTGADRRHALRTLGEAWARVPDAPATGGGVRIRITPGVVPYGSVRNGWLEGHHGSAAAPISIEAAEGAGTVTIDGGLNVYDVAHLSFVGLRFVAGGGHPAASDVALHVERADHLTLRRVWVTAGHDLHEGLKVNQSQHVYVEDSTIAGSYENPVDFVAVQYGHVLRSNIHHGDDWCMYAKGGSAHLVIAGNRFHHCGTGGFSAGQGTGFEFMTAPWLHYEAYGIEFVDNVVHDTDGAGMGVNGGFDVLLAHNTLYRVGARSHVIEVEHGGRGCDGDTGTCRAHRDLGGWGPASGDIGQVIPNRHVYVLNNVVENPAPFRSKWQQFDLRGPVHPPTGANVPDPSHGDDDLRIAGNVIWNGPRTHPLGIEGSTACTDENPTCNAAQLRRDNRINTVEPRLVHPGSAPRDFRLVGGAVAGATLAPVPPAIWSDAPSRPDLRDSGRPWSDAVRFTRSGEPRTASSPPGAY